MRQTGCRKIRYRYAGPGPQFSIEDGGSRDTDHFDRGYITHE